METIISYLRERTIKTRVDNKLSSPLNLLAGVPQGSILGPMLFNIFVSDLKYGLDCDVQILQYADDCQLLLKFDKEAKFEEIIQKVERVIGQVSKWSEDNLLILNNDKTQILPIYNRNSVFSKMPFFSQHNFTFMKEAKNLGVFYNFRFNWSTHFNHILSTMRKSIYHMKQFFRRYTTKSDYFIRKKIVLTILYPSMCYGTELFYDFSNNCNTKWDHMRKLLANAILLKYCSTNDLNSQSIPSLKDSIDYNLFCKIAKETNRTTTPPIISFHLPQLTKRNCDTIKCTLPPISHSKTIFEYCAYLFNSLPDETKSALLSGISISAVKKIGKQLFLS